MALDVHPQITTRRLVALVALVLVAGAVTASDPVHAAVRPVVAWAQAFIGRSPTLGVVVFVVLSALSAMFAFLSSGLLAPVAIAAWGKGETFVLLWLGWLVGGVLTYAVGRYLGRSVAKTIAGEDALTSAESFVRDRTHVLHVAVLQLALPSEILGYVLGILRYRFTYYLGVLAITELPFALAVIYLGESFLEGRAYTFVLVGLVTVGASASLYALARRFIGRQPVG